MFVSTCRGLLRSQKYRFSRPFYTLTTTVPYLNQNTIKPCRFFSSDNSTSNAKLTDKKKERAKTPEAPKITLLNIDNSIVTVTTVAEAEKIASGKKLKLVKVVDKDAKTVRPVYKLMSEADFIEEDLKVRRQHKEEKKKKGNSYIKGEKLLILSTNITTFDLEIKIRKAEKWLEKKYEVRALISGNPNNPPTSAQEEIYKKFEKSLQGKSRIVQKMFKSGNLKFHILPLREEADSKNDETKSSTNDESDAAESSTM